MKKFFKLFGASLLIVLIFRLLLDIFLKFLHPEVVAQFPYYISDLLKRYPGVNTVWAFFDGIHYLRIADYGYHDVGTQAFFPLYPLLIHFITPLFPSSLIAGEFISLLSLALALTGFRYLFPNHVPSTIYYLLFLIFPTSFFFASVYTESLFLALSIWFFVLLKKKLFLPAALLAGFASATRFAGIFLSLSLIFEYCRINQFQFKNHKSKIFNLVLIFLISITGLTLYMFYLYRTFHDPLMFIHVQPMFGGSRSGGELILLPQVIWRYLKIFATVEPTTLVFFRSLFEFGTFSFFAYLLIRFYKSMPFVQSLYLGLSLLLPTFSGTLSSLPRYALVLFPFFLPFLPFRKYFVLYAICFMLMIWSFNTFARGYFIS